MQNLTLVHLTAPLFVTRSSRINDHLNSDTRIVSFTGKDKVEYEIVQSTAKWKRQTIQRLHVPLDTGIVVDMRAIRCDEELSNIHSYFVDQWDWEFHITKEQRTLETLYEKAKLVYKSVLATTLFFEKELSLPSHGLPEEPFVLSTDELETLYPDLTPKEREHAIAKQHRAVILTKIGHKHDRRAFDYDDWTLNADIIVWSDVLNFSIELSSMGVRVDSESLIKQYALVNIDNAPLYELSSYHKDIYYDDMPYTIGGGIGQSRLAMFVLNKEHISEVQPFCE